MDQSSKENIKISTGVTQEIVAESVSSSLSCGESVDHHCVQSDNVKNENDIDLKAVICLEDGLADDDSWVEEISYDEEDYVTTTDSDVDCNGDQSVENLPTKKEEVREFNRTPIDFTLHTIIEESCEEGDVEQNEILRRNQISASELEKYFFYGLVDGKQLSSFETKEDSNSDVSSICSENIDLLGLPQDTVGYVKKSTELASSRLEKYFLTGFMGFAEQNGSDDSESVGSDSDGHPSPSQRRKRLVRARGSQRSRSSSLDNLLTKDDNSEIAENYDNLIDSSESETNNEKEYQIDQGEMNDTLKRKKQGRKRHDSDEKKGIQVANELNMEKLEKNKTKPAQIDFLLPVYDNLLKPRNECSRDSGFIGSNDDLLKNEEISKHSDSIMEGKQMKEQRGSVLPKASTAAFSLIRKDSFNNWSSDEETNLMMTKMRHFLKTLVAANVQNVKNGARNSNAVLGRINPSKSNIFVSRSKSGTKSVQLTYFENELTRLMKTVPGINDEQVREIVEYLSSEDTWSDSYESSDYTSSDIEETVNATGQTELKQQISASCRQIIKKFDNAINDEEGDRGDGGLIDESHSINPETAFVYHKLVTSFSEMATGEGENQETETSNKSPQLLAKVMHHIGTRLVALMHEVKSGESNENSSPIPSQRHQKSLHQKSTYKPVEEENNIYEQNLQKIEINHINFNNLPRSKSHDILSDIRPHPVTGNDIIADEKEASDYERFSWRGSFESALPANGDSRTKLSLIDRENSAPALALTTKRRSASDLLFNNKSNSREQLDRVRSCGSIGGNAEEIYLESSELWKSEKNGLNYRRSSVPEAICESESDRDADHFPTRATLPRSVQANLSASTNSLPRIPNIPNLVQKSQSVYYFLPNRVKSARYRPPGFNLTDRLQSLPKKYSSTSRLQQLLFVNRDAKRRYNLNNEEKYASDFHDFPLSESCTASGLDLSVCHKFSEHNSTQSEDDIATLHQNRKCSNLLGARTDSLASIYSGAGEGRYGTVSVKGKVEFGMQYNYKQSALEIHVVQCKDLASVDLRRNRSDPYVKVYLLPDKSKNGKRKTKVKKHTLNPIFDETLKFHLPLSSLDARTLWLTIWHSDIFGRNDFLGEVIIPLQGKVFDNPQSQWYPLQERSELFEDVSLYKGDIVVGLKFIPSDCLIARKKISKRNTTKLKDLNSFQMLNNYSAKGQLHVLVKEAKNLSPVKSTGTCDAFCKSYLLPDKTRNSKQKTPVAKRSTNPVWNYTFIYENVSLQDLSERALELTIWDHDRLTSNEFLGGVRFSLGTGKHCQKSVDWMDATGKELSLWQNMLNRPNFWVEGGVMLRSSLDGGKLFL